MVNQTRIAYPSEKPSPVTSPDGAVTTSHPAVGVAVESRNKAPVTRFQAIMHYVQGNSGDQSIGQVVARIDVKI